MLPIFTFFTAPSATTTLSDAGTWSSALFTDLSGVIPIAVGLIIGGLLVALLIRSILRGVKPVLGGRRGRGRRGRR